MQQSEAMKNNQKRYRYGGGISQKILPAVVAVMQTRHQPRGDSLDQISGRRSETPEASRACLPIMMIVDPVQLNVRTPYRQELPVQRSNVE